MEKKIYVANAFSLSMLGGDAILSVKEVPEHLISALAGILREIGRAHV